MPSGFWLKSMYGALMISLSSTIAKCWKAACGEPPKLFSVPRWTIPRVVSSQILRPLSVKSKVTFGAPVPPGLWSKFCSGFLMSVPLSAGWSRSTKKESLSLSSPCAFSAAITTVPGLTSTTLVSSVCLMFLSSISASRSARVSWGPARTRSFSVSTR